MKTTITVAVGVAFMLSASLGVAQPPVGNSPLDQGKRVYDYWCLPCHGEGLGLPGFAELPGTQQLRIKYRDAGISPLLTERTDRGAHRVFTGRTAGNVGISAVKCEVSLVKFAQ